ncbi:YihY/virulence factor BrkB family protein [Streptomyces fructofermentans]|nr:YihY/virulence factor BrkB family protein [Streptomyces fructofermentans]
MWNDDVSDWAAALTYYSILALLPAMLVTVTAFGLISPDTAEGFAEHVTAYAPGESSAQLHHVLEGMLRERSAAWTVLVAGSGSALWSASNYLAVCRRALHRMHGVEDHRSALRTAHRLLFTAVALLVLLVISAATLLLTGPLAEAIGGLVGLGHTAAVVWSVLKWPVLVALVTLLVVVVFHTGPPPARRRRHSLPGGVLAAGLWLVTSAGFALYASSLSTYSEVYGSLAGVVVFLIWLWLSNLALLAGAQFTAELRALREARHLRVEKAC